MRELMPDSDKIILDLCGGTGAWSRNYKDAGYDVRLVTLPEHDVRLYQPPDNVYGILAAPPCTHFSSSRLTANSPRDLRKAMAVVVACLGIIYQCQFNIKSQFQKKPPLKFWALENPYSMLRWFLGEPPLKFHPYEYGNMYKKKTAIWGYFNVPPKTNRFIPECPNIEKIGVKELARVMQLNLDEIPKEKGTRRLCQVRAITPHGFARAFFESNR